MQSNDELLKTEIKSIKVEVKGEYIWINIIIVAI